MDPAVVHGAFGDGVELVGADADVAEGSGQAEIGDEFGDGVGGVHAGSATQSWRAAFAGRLKRSTCGSMTKEV